MSESKKKFVRKRLKGLFVTTDFGIYGSARSLQMLLNNCDNLSYDLAIKAFFVKEETKKEVKKNFKNVKKIYAIPAPIDQCFVGSRDKNFMDMFFYPLKLFLWVFSNFKIRIINMINKYDFIHVNSVALNRVLSPDLPFVMHVRELIYSDNDFQIDKIKSARGVIFIDSVVKKPFEHKNIKSIVLENPCDMRRKPQASNPVGVEESIIKNKIIFSIVGSINEEKGVLFVLNAFLNVSSSDAVILVIGGANNKRYEEECKVLAAKDDRVFFYGEERDYEVMKEIYFKVDYLIRGDSIPRIGRTTLEALHAGCRVIVPVEKNTDVYDDFKSEWRDNIIVYETRNKEALTKLIESVCGGKPARNLKCTSNAKEYSHDFLRFIEQCLNI